MTGCPARGRRRSPAPSSVGCGSAAAQCVLESAEAGQNHPLNVGGPLHPAGSTSGAALFSRYTAGFYVAESLQRWRAFVAATAQAGTIQVVESYPFQNAARVLLQMDAGAGRIREYVTTLEQIVLPLRPVLVYFEHPDAAEALRASAAQRGPAWAASAVELITDCPYARRRGLHGLEGALTFMGVYKALMDDLRRRTRLPVWVLADCAGRWDACRQQVLEFLEG